MSCCSLGASVGVVEAGPGSERLTGGATPCASAKSIGLETRAAERFDESSVEVGRRGEALFPPLGQGLDRHGVERGGDPCEPRDVAGHRHRLLHMPGEHLVVRADEGGPPGEEVEEDEFTNGGIPGVRMRG